MNRRFSALLLLLAVTGYVHAEGDVYLCVDNYGNKEYKNTDITKGCKKIDLPGLTMIPAPKRREGRIASARPAESPAGFPRIDSGTQKARDDERRRILLEEMQNEQQKLAELEKAYNNGQPERRGDERNYAKYQQRVALMKEDISRAEKNIDALQREIGNLK